MHRSLHATFVHRFQYLYFFHEDGAGIQSTPLAALSRTKDRAISVRSIYQENQLTTSHTIGRLPLLALIEVGKRAKEGLVYGAGCD